MQLEELSPKLQAKVTGMLPKTATISKVEIFDKKVLTRTEKSATIFFNYKGKEYKTTTSARVGKS